MQRLSRTFGLLASCLIVSVGCESRPDTMDDSAESDNSMTQQVVVGAELPQFELVTLDDPESVYSREDLDGAVYLLDFWATWCLPCIAELPNLHAAYDTFKDRGFEILSVAMGDRRDEIERLRSTQHPMPWLHAFEPLDSDAARIFELFGVPKVILVDSTHTIVAMDEDVKGDKLHQELERLLGPER